MRLDLLTYLIPIAATLASVIAGVLNIISTKKELKEKKSEVTHLLKTGIIFNTLKNDIVKSDTISSIQIYNSINNVNKEIKKLFDELTNSNCRTTIRVIVYDDNVPLLVSLISSSSSNIQPEFKMYKTKLSEDTTIRELLTHNKQYYLFNNLNSLKSHLPIIPKSPTEKEWHFLYHSSLILPITRTKKDSEYDMIYGFLSIDSDKKHAFNKDLHIVAAKEIVDYFIPILSIWTKKMTLRNDGNLFSNLDRYDSDLLGPIGD